MAEKFHLRDISIWGIKSQAHSKVYFKVDNMKKIIILMFTAFLLFTGLLACFSQEISKPQTQDNSDYASAKVLKIISETKNQILQDSIGGNQVTQFLQVKILTGKLKGKIMNIENQLSSNPAYDIYVKPGSRVVVDIDQTEPNQEINIADNERTPALMAIAGLFFVLLLTIGGIKGLKSLISIGTTGLLVFSVLIPAILNKAPVIPVTIGIAVLSTFLSIFLVSGINIKSLSACLGTIGSLLLSGLISMFIIKFAPLNGFKDQESIILWSTRPDLDFTGILTSAMIIGSLGAIMDVGISIASSIAEIKSINKTLNAKQLIESGLNVGKDIMGAMSNTLILAYVGSALPLILLAINAPIVKLLNLNSIAAEITAALAGSIGIILCVPLTATIAGLLIARKNIDEQILENINN